jgi:hypothetical protein
MAGFAGEARVRRASGEGAQSLGSPVEPYRRYTTVRRHGHVRAVEGDEVRDGDAGNVTVTCGNRAGLHVSS